MKFGSLFAGIGGFDLGLERAGMECAWQVEIDEFCQKVLTKHWPDVPKYRDIREVGDNLEPVDLICGGWPCQPFSQAGKKKGRDDERYLWPEMLRIIRELRPTWVFGENVENYTRMELDQSSCDLESIGYSVQSFVISSYCVGTPFDGKRTYVLATTDDKRPVMRRVRELQTIAETQRCGDYHRGGAQPSIQGGRWEIKSRPYGVADGVPNRVDRLRSLGNAVVPQVAEVIGRAIMEIESR